MLIQDPESSWAADGTIRSINISTEDYPDSKLDLSEITSSPLHSLALKTPQSISDAIELSKFSISKYMPPIAPAVAEQLKQLASLSKS